ncbi:hypothetical protein [Lactobacillus gallinarum]|uniref:hypothetical protein n=1 Tax=Lactobacillus gallinarum TaxID=52242 RepID=UPI0024B0D301|nr:hypothetical protein [Lactobacillus gallinarum]
MIAIIGSIAMLVALISAFLWLIVIFLKKGRLKAPLRRTFIISGIIFLGCGFITMINHPDDSDKKVITHHMKKEHNTHVKKEHKKKKAHQFKLKVYPIIIQSVSSKNKHFIINGKTNAPDGAKIYVRSIYNNNCARSNKDEWAKVNNHQFRALININDLTSQEVCPIGKEIITEAFAINNYESKNWDAPYNSGLKKKVKEANIKNTKLVVDNEIHNSMYKTKIKDEIDDSFSNFHSLVKKDLKDFSLNGNEVLLSKDGSTVTISLQIPTRQYFDGMAEYLSHLFNDIKKVKLDSRLSNLLCK